MASFSLAALLALTGHVAAVQHTAAVLLQLKAEVMNAEEWAGAGHQNSDSTSSLAAKASISEWGYERVAQLRSNDEMEKYIRRNLEEADLKIKDGHDADLEELIPRYSGDIATQSIEALHEELAESDWVTYARLKKRDGDNSSDDVAEVEVSPGANESANFVAKKACKSIQQGNYMNQAEPARIIVARELHKMPQEQKTELLQTLTSESPRIVLQTGKGSVRFFTVLQLQRMLERGTFHLLADLSPEELARNLENEDNNGPKSQRKKTKRLANLLRRYKDVEKEKRTIQHQVSKEEKELAKLSSQVKAISKDKKQTNKRKGRQVKAGRRGSKK